MSRKTVTLLDVTVSRVPEGVPPRSLRIWPAGAAPLPNLPESRRYPFWKAEKCIHFFRSTCSLLPPPDLRHFGSQTQCCSCSQMACRLLKHKTVIKMPFCDLKLAKKILARRPKGGRRGGLHGLRGKTQGPHIQSVAAHAFSKMICSPVRGEAPLFF